MIFLVALGLETALIRCEPALMEALSLPNIEVELTVSGREDVRKYPEIVLKSIDICFVYDLFLLQVLFMDFVFPAQTCA